MKRFSCLLGSAAAIFAVGQAMAMEGMPKTNVSMEKCLAAALAMHPGEVKELEMTLEDGVPHYEFEIETADGRETEVECDAMTGKIVEVEWENDDMDLDTFLKNAKVTPAQARKAALERVPGRIVGMDLETTAEGAMSYEFEVITPDGKEMDVEVDAMTGKVTEVEFDLYEIGD
ncbi:MAG TPA: PepSY domain-containing protein [Burkholderiales bacterium]|nr:PepSY domain-containing protein [Burkholderiales bacterium]